MLEEVGMIQGWWSRPCNTSHSTASTLARSSAGTLLQERVWVREACKQAPPTIACREGKDAATLCATCDMDILSINPHVSQHNHVPILPISGNGMVACGRGRAMVGPFSAGYIFEEDVDAKCHLLPSSMLNSQGSENQNCIEFSIGNKVEEHHVLDPKAKTMIEDDHIDKYDYLELLDHGEKHNENDGVVLSQLVGEWEPWQGLEKLDFTNPASLSFSISSPSREASMIPNTAIIEISKSDSMPSRQTLELFTSPLNQTKARLDRHARVLRYREKKKRRNFEKTIRYTSRKAYAEIRPRINGRFAKISDLNLEVDRMLHATISAEFTYEYTYGYGLVPSF